MDGQLVLVPGLSCMEAEAEELTRGRANISWRVYESPHLRQARFDFELRDGLRFGFIVHEREYHAVGPHDTTTKLRHLLRDKFMVALHEAVNRPQLDNNAYGRV